MPVRPMIAAAVLAGFVTVANAQEAPATLKVGDPAPPLAVGKWVKGEPTKIEAGRVFVVEFWATWCGPCRASIPHLSELAKKHTDVTFVGQDVFEQDETKVEPFVTQMGDKMSYRVATDDKSKDPQGAMAATWMKAAGQNGIPTAFIVGKDGKIAWIGHPMDGEFEGTLEKVVAGTFDVKAAAEAKGKMDVLNKELSTAVRAGKIDDALKAAAEIGKLKPEAAEQITMFEYGLLARGGRLDEARTRAAKILETGKNPESFNTIAWSIAVRKDATADDLKTARTAADKANALTSNKQADFLDTSARLYAVDKDWTKAVETEKKAIDVAEGDAKADLQKTLDAYQKQELPAAN